MHALENLKAIMVRVKHKIESSTEMVSFQIVLDACPAMIYWQNLDGTLLGLNDAVLPFFGVHHKSEAVGKKLHELVGQKAAKKMNDMDKLIATHARARLERRDFRDYNGGIFLTYKIPLRNNNGNIYGVSGMSVDITSYENTGRRFDEMFDFVDLLQAKNRFLENITHATSVPLQLLLSLPDGLEEDFYRLTNDEKVEYLSILIGSNKKYMPLLSYFANLEKENEPSITSKIVSNLITTNRVK